VLFRVLAMSAVDKNAFCHDIGSIEKQDFSLRDFGMSHQLAWPKCHTLAHDWVAWDWNTSQKCVQNEPSFAVVRCALVESWQTL